MAELTEISVKTALTKSRIYGVEYVINPYLGCSHGCRYCYATFMRQYARTHQQARWGSFVEVKANLPQVLALELARRKKPPAAAMLSSVCDPYQPCEARYKLTRQCVELLHAHRWEVGILTRSPLVMRDAQLLRAAGASVGMSIPTEDDRIRKLLEPDAPPIGARLKTLERLKAAGISTWVFVAPMLTQHPDRLHELVAPLVDSAMVSRLNYYEMVAPLLKRAGLTVLLDRQLSMAHAARLRELFGEGTPEV